MLNKVMLTIVWVFLLVGAEDLLAQKNHVIPTAEEFQKQVPEGVTWIADIPYRQCNEAWKLDLTMPEEIGSSPQPGKRSIRMFDKNGDGIVSRGEIANEKPTTPSRADRQKPAENKPLQPRWVDPCRSEPAGTKYKTFHSKTINSDVSYLIYLPPEYDKETSRRYPVLYWLHGGGGNQRVGAYFVELADKAIRADRVPAMIIVLVNGLRSSLFNDSADGQRPVESVIIKDLIPHIDATYRTMADRAGRGIEGFSMGGYGATHLAFKFPELFGVVSNLAGAVLDVDFFATFSKGRILEDVFSGDREAFQRNHPFTLAEKNADAIRGRTFVRIVVGDKDTGRGTLQANRKFHQLLEQLKFQHGYVEVPGVRHSYRALYDTLGDAAFEFFAKAFGTNTQKAKDMASLRNK